MVQYTNEGALRQQVEAIFIERIYGFRFDHPASRPARIIDCGSNIGLSAIWFLQNYPQCRLTCFEADADIAEISRGNLQRAGFHGNYVTHAAAWIANGRIGFDSAGDDKGRITTGSAATVPAVDLAEFLNEPIDLLKMDIEGAEWEILKYLFEGKHIANIQRMAIEFHDLDENIEAFADILHQMHASGFQVRFRGGALPWLENGDKTRSDFDCIARGPIFLDLFACR